MSRYSGQASNSEVCSTISSLEKSPSKSQSSNLHSSVNPAASGSGSEFHSGASKTGEKYHAKSRNMGLKKK